MMSLADVPSPRGGRRRHSVTLAVASFTHVTSRDRTAGGREEGREEIREGGRGDRHVSVVHAVPLH